MNPTVRSLRRLLTLLTLLAIAATGSLPALAADLSEDFEGSSLVEGDAVTTEFAGLTITDAQLITEGAPRAAYNSAVTPDDVTTSGVSGSDFLGPNPLFTTTPIAIVFDDLASGVSFQCYDIDAAEKIDFEAYDASGTLLEQITVSTGDAGTGDAIATLVEFSVSDIQSIEIDPQGGSGHGVDDLSWTMFWDSDGDGVDDDEDTCPDSDYSLGETVDSTGCTIADHCPCEGEWKNHGEYTRCVAHATNDFKKEGLISGPEKGGIQSEAAGSDCGK